MNPYSMQSIRFISWKEYLWPESLLSSMYASANQNGLRHGSKDDGVNLHWKKNFPGIFF